MWRKFLILLAFKCKNIYIISGVFREMWRERVAEHFNIKDYLEKLITLTTTRSLIFYNSRAKDVSRPAFSMKGQTVRKDRAQSHRPKSLLWDMAAGLPRENVGLPVSPTNSWDAGGCVKIKKEVASHE